MNGSEMLKDCPGAAVPAAGRSPPASILRAAAAVRRRVPVLAGGARPFSRGGERAAPPPWLAGRDLAAGAKLALPLRDDGVADVHALSHRRLLALLQIDLHGTRLHRLIVLHDVGEGTVGSALHGGERHHDRTRPRVEEEPRLNELVRPQRVLRVRQHRLQAQRRRGGIDGVVDDFELSPAQLRVAIAREHPDLERALPELPGELRQDVLREREDDRDGIELRDGDDAGRVVRVDEVSGIDVADAGDAVDGRGDPRVSEVEPRRLDRGAVDAHRSLELPDHRPLIVRLLDGDELALGEILEPGQVLLRREELGLVAREGAFRRVELDLERARIDLREDVALLHFLPLAEQHLVEPAVHLGAHRHRLVGGHRPEAVEKDGEVLLLHLRDAHADDALARLSATLGGLVRVASGGDMLEQESSDSPGGHVCPRARRSCARAVESRSSACTVCASAVVSATWASPSSMALPTPVSYRPSARRSLSRAFNTVSRCASRTDLAARMASKACSTSSLTWRRCKSSCAESWPATASASWTCALVSPPWNNCQLSVRPRVAFQVRSSGFAPPSVAPTFPEMVGQYPPLNARTVSSCARTWFSIDRSSGRFVSACCARDSRAASSSGTGASDSSATS